MADRILVFNSGSSTIKIGVFARDRTEVAPLFKGLLDKHADKPRLALKSADGQVAFETSASNAESDGFVDELLEWLGHESGPLAAVGHRVVHGGAEFNGPVVCTSSIVDQLSELTPLAPLHQPHCLAPIRTIASKQPDLLQIACFDTAFHRTMDTTRRRVGLPRRFESQGIRKYGFHGLSYEYIASRLRAISPTLASGKIVVAHLGSGASLCAMNNGESVDTTMGVTPLDNLLMATRCGSIDPGALLHLQITEGMSPDALQHMLYEQSGLLGVSDISGDMRTLLNRTEPSAKAAIDLFCSRAAAGIAAMCHSLRGLDGIVFTGGIGENSSDVRQRICDDLGWLNVHIDEPRNSDGVDRIVRDDAPIDVRVIATSEETTIARHVAALL